ncbi:hypothetical protein LCI18_009805 [Fusarium solani-melongenae]|uniref:Uncharacterized protein n=1 Tax=Fusarium solani subsp. cucurbitae TaxID=2747967 RepID=A0ACD3ZCD2_FUSSC|nr:hypothetical protein LCI18_009805 [Fusarium solani-melongenae]
MFRPSTLRAIPLRALSIAAVVGTFLFLHLLLASGSQSTTLSPPPTLSSRPPRPSPPPVQTPTEFVASTVDWSSLQLQHPPVAVKPLPQGAAQTLPKVQAEKSKFSFNKDAEKRRDAVRDEFLRGWSAYRQHAWMRDELMPVSAQWRDSFGGWAATLVDSLDTLWIMDLREEFEEAANAAATLNWGERRDGAIDVFKLTTRHLGGLLGAYELSGQEALLKKATELGEMLYVAFDTPNRIPTLWLDFDEAENGTQIAGSHDPSAAPASLAMEFTRLSQLTGDSKFYDATDRVTQFLSRVQNSTKLPGMWPIYLNFERQVAEDNTFTLGALADSMYEYLIKMHALLGGLDRNYERMYRMATKVVADRLLYRPKVPNQDDVLLVGEIHVEGKAEFTPETQHLTCFAGGMFALGGKLLANEEHVKLGEKLALGCHWAFKSFATGIMPEIFRLEECPTLEPCDYDEEAWAPEGEPIPPGFRHVRDPRYLLRPEAVESIFIMYRLTGDSKWQDMAWEMFEAIKRFTTTEHGNAAVEDIISVETKQTDSMESFWLGETLKYFYLIFSPPDLVSLDEYVLTTGAHTFRRPTK